MRTLFFLFLIPISISFSVVMQEHTPPKRVVICGAGVIGASVAYYLSLRGTPAFVIDRAGVAKAASGKAGGFLALDWNDGSPVGPLARKSFFLHEELAKTLSLDSYRRLTCSAITLDESRVGQPSKYKDAEWVDLGAKQASPLGTRETIAQVHPRQLTEALMAAATARGCSLRIGRVERVEVCDEATGKRAAGVWVDGELVEADAVVVAMGPWSQQASGGLGLPPLYGQKYHSVLMQSRRELSEAVFFSGLGDPEVYPRPAGEVYVTGFPDPPVVVAEAPGQEEVRGEVGERLVAAMKLVSTELGAAVVKTHQACHLPITEDGCPLIGAVGGIRGAYVAAGHSCWGILNGPATGLALSELLLDGCATSVDLFPFRPDRFH